MHGRLFSLVYPDDEGDVYGWGVEFLDVDEQRAVVILPDGTGRMSFSVHDSAEGALRCWSKLEELDLKWVS